MGSAQNPGPGERPMSGSTFVLVTIAMVVIAVLVLRWIIGTLAFVFDTLLLLAVVGGAVFLYLKLRRGRP